MKRVAAPRDVRQARAFLAASELHRCTIFVEPFRGCYHDVLQRRTAQRVAQRSRVQLSVSPDEAASQVGVAGAAARVLKAMGSARSGASSATAESRPALRALRKVMQGSERAPCGHHVTAEVSREDRPSPGATFSLSSAEEPQSGPPTRVWTTFVSPMRSAAPLFPA